MTEGQPALRAAPPMSEITHPRPVPRASYPLRGGNRVATWIDGADSFRRIFDLVARAKRSAWITVSFVDLDLVLPGSGARLIDRLGELATRGVDVRLLFWWSEYAGIGSFRGEADELAAIAPRAAHIRMRWDNVPRGCHHQKSYVIDGEIAFVGGINLTHESVSAQSHHDETFHDLFAELRGPCVTDVAANFRERWNQATETLGRGHAFPSPESADELPWPVPVPSAATDGAPVQVVRTIKRGLYRGRSGRGGADDFDLAEGEQSVRDAVLDAIAGASASIYIENQYLLDVETIGRLTEAAARGVDVVAVVPRFPDPNLLMVPKDRLAESRAALRELGGSARARLFALAHPADPDAQIYVHSKPMIVDDHALLVGSANFWQASYRRDSELDLLVWSPSLARSTRRRLWLEHLGTPSAASGEDWARLAEQHRPGCRAVELDPAAYYGFPADLRAPWQDLIDRP